MWGKNKRERSSYKYEASEGDMILNSWWNISKGNPFDCVARTASIVYFLLNYSVHTWLCSD